MDTISESDIRARVSRDNPWWVDSAKLPSDSGLPHRVYFAPFARIALNFEVRRATVLLGPRRVGKTVMAKQLVAEAINRGVRGRNILYITVDAPIYLGISLERFLEYVPGAKDGQKCVVIFDEIQYLPQWEVHLKDLVDSFPNVKFIASGSAAAALKLRSKESGAGRFSDFMLPPLTFYEFLLFQEEQDKYVIEDPAAKGVNRFRIVDIEGLNTKFIDYLNFGGYPEVVFNEEIRSQSDQFIRNDIIDKVLLKDLPSLYGISDIQELNKLFSVLAYNTGSEASFEGISQKSSITKPTIKKYIEYLESAFLIIKVSSVDDNCRTLQRARSFKIYLNNPSMRAALFSPVSADDAASIGRLTESAIYSQWQHSRAFASLRYARWKNEGEVDIVYLEPSNQKPTWIGEIKWSDRIATSPSSELTSLSLLVRRHPTIKDGFITSRTHRQELEVSGKPFTVIPSSAYCYIVGKNITSSIGLSLKDMTQPQSEPQQQLPLST